MVSSAFRIDYFYLLIVLTSLSRVALIPLSPIPKEKLPKDFNHPIVSGRSILSSNIFLASQLSLNTGNYMMLLNPDGEVLWYRKCNCYNGKMYRNRQGKIRYTYFDDTYDSMTIPDSLSMRYLHVMNEDMEVIDIVTAKEYDDVIVNTLPNHDYLFIDD